MLRSKIFPQNAEPRYKASRPRATFACASAVGLEPMRSYLQWILNPLPQPLGQTGFHERLAFTVQRGRPSTRSPRRSPLCARALACAGYGQEPRGSAALRPSDHQLQVAVPSLPKCALLRGSPWRWSGALLPMFCIRAKQYQFSRPWSDLQRGARVCAAISVSQLSWQSLRFRMRRVVGVGPMPCALAARPTPRSRSTSARAPQSPSIRTTLGAGHASRAD